MLARYRIALGVLLFYGFQAPARTHAQSENPAPQNKPYTIEANSRVVLTDVTVTNRKGNPVRGLPESAFRIFDNDKLQTVTSFEEHTGIGAVTDDTAAIRPGVYSDDYLLHLPPVLSVVLIDIANLEITDQMYLYYELTRFFKERGTTQPLAMYLRAGNGCFLVQNFTRDRESLLKALRRAIPRIPPTGPEYLSDIDTLGQIADHLRQLPGRKNVLWFSGGSTLYLHEDATLFQGAALDLDAASHGDATLLTSPEQHDDPAQWRKIYDDLEQERIAVYPIDARGLTTNMGLTRTETQWAQQAMMIETARSTGGQAFYNSNGLTEITQEILGSDTSFYTLTYSPRDFHFDNQWHRVRIALNIKDYELSYRHGYFADRTAVESGQLQKTRPRMPLLPDGEQVQLPDIRRAPIIFQARVLPASDPDVTSAPPLRVTIQAPPPDTGAVPYSIRYVVPVNELTPQTVDGKPQATLGIAAILLNHDGRPDGSNADRVTMTLDNAEIQAHPDFAIALDQRLNLKHDDKYLYLAVWDMTSGRLGTLQVPLDVPKPGKPVR
ncbi:MAG TPA: VWA domain-containing protein [Silvibacterium sp.]|nr:VWA domain-containing protein [Silvibacterium sp.]